jgi:hypothetical protein
MSDFKFCDSCGNKLSMTALFCSKCGQKQEPVSVPESVPQPEEKEQEPINAQVSEENITSDISAIEEEQITNDEPINETTIEETELADQISESDAEKIDESVTEPILAETDSPVKSETAEPATQQPQNTYTQPVQQPIQQPQPAIQPQPAVQPQPAAQPQPQPQYQSPYYPQSVQTSGTQPQTEVVKKKKFPWIFTALWFILLVAVGVWAYFLLVHPTYDYPRFTEDAQRIALFTAAIAALIYTLSLKLTMRKLKALPTVILVLLALAGFFFFCLVELQEGEFLHDAVVNIIESVSP